MATSTNYGWSEPDNTSLVKDGAQAIRTLGDAIDTSLWNVGYGQAGKNKIINGNFGVAQRGTSITMAQNGYNLDRWTASVATAFPTGTITQQTMTAGNTIAGYEFANYARINPTVANGCTAWQWTQKIEDVRVFAGVAATVSFWAKADASCTATIDINQNFGSGGSATVTAMAAQNIALTTAWTRFTFTATFPSISGKTIGTGSSVDVRFSLPLSSGVIRLGTYDIAGVQLEYGSKATPFQTASGGSPQAELAMCQRYYHRFNLNSGSYSRAGVGTASSTTNAKIFIPFNTTMRTTPTAVDYSTLGLFDSVNTYVITSVALDQLGPENGTIDCGVASGLTQFRPYFLYYGNTTGAYVGFSAEL
jgi:hypothetical protein